MVEEGRELISLDRRSETVTGVIPNETGYAIKLGG
jgi:hypothetical protein